MATNDNLFTESNELIAKLLKAFLECEGYDDFERTINE